MKKIRIKTDTIRLGQFLKVAGVVETGGEAKLRVQEGEVMVNDQLETRRGRQLHPGDVIRLGPHLLEVEGP